MNVFSDQTNMTFASDFKEGYISANDVPLYMRQWFTSGTTSKQSSKQKIGNQRAGTPVVFVGHSTYVHGGWLNSFCSNLHTKGKINVANGDLRSHGKSGLKAGTLAHLDPETGWEDMKSDMRDMLEQAFENVPWEDRCVIGSNMTALLLVDILKTWPDMAKNIILVSPPPNQPEKARMALMVVNARLSAETPNYRDSVMESRVFSFLAENIMDIEKPTDVLSIDPAIVKALLEDREGFQTPTLGYWKCIFSGYEKAWEGFENVEIAKDTRLLVLYGDCDPLMVDRKLAKNLETWFHSIGGGKVTIRSLPKARANLLIDEDHFNLSGIVLNWLKKSATDKAFTPSKRNLPSIGETDNMFDQQSWSTFASASLESSIGEFPAKENRLQRDKHDDFEMPIKPLPESAPDTVSQYLLSVFERLQIGTAVLSRKFDVIYYNSVFRNLVFQYAGTSAITNNRIDDDYCVNMAIKQLLSSNRVGRGKKDECLVMVDDHPVGCLFLPPDLTSGSTSSNPDNDAYIMMVLREGGRKSLPGDKDNLAKLAMLENAYNLTPKEANVALQVANGISTEALAAQLDISVHTARTHLKRCYEKVGVKSQSELVAVLLGSFLGLI